MEIRLAKITDPRAEEQSRSTRDLYYHDQLVRVFGRVVTAWVVLELVGDRADANGDLILLRGDNTAAVSWISRYGGVRDNRACLLVRRLRRLEIKEGRSHNETRIPSVRNTLFIADGVSRWPRVILADKVREGSSTLTADRNKTLEQGVRGSPIPYDRQRTFSASMTFACGQ